MINLELLSPAKDLEGLKMHLNSGADSVYIGGESFGMNKCQNKLF